MRLERLPNQPNEISELPVPAFPPSVQSSAVEAWAKMRTAAAPAGATAGGGYPAVSEHHFPHHSHAFGVGPPAIRLSC